MFTGIIEKKGILKNRRKNGKAGELIIKATPFDNPIIGESIAINGCCLSLESFTTDGTLTFHTLEETLAKTNLGATKIGSEVNLERALRVGDRLGGHWVSGHIDCLTEVISNRKKGSDIELKIKVNADLEKFIIPKGSIAINGVSLTIVECTTKYLTVHLIPLTLGDTNLANLKTGEFVNIESDIIGKYLYFQSQNKSKVTLAKLMDAGFF